MISDVSFGKIVVAGQAFTSDVLIFPDGRVQDGWWRREGHRLTYEDLAPLLESDPQVIVVGTGIYGRLRPDPDLARRLRRLGIELLARPTAAAVELFNQRAGSSRVAAGLHLTC
jgi:hypothetical protein